MKQAYITIHQAIHDPNAKEVTVDGLVKPIRVLERNGCRYVDHWDPEDGAIRFMEQNKNSKSDYARRARSGEKITWGTRDRKPWILVTDKST